MRSEPSVYVIDAHALHWYWRRPGLLGQGARAALERIEANEAVGLVPAIVAMELHYLWAKAREPRSMETILAYIDASPSLRLESLSRQHLTATGRVSDIREMHDRLIAATTLVHNATLLTRDEILRAHRLLRTEW